MQQVHLRAADYAVFGFLLAVPASIGIYFACTGRRQRTVQEFLMGDRLMGVLPVSMSLLASFITAIGMISMPVELYLFGAGISYLFLGTCLALPVAATCYLPVFYNLKLTSVNQVSIWKGDLIPWYEKWHLFSLLYNWYVYCITIKLRAPYRNLEMVTGVVFSMAAWGLVTMGWDAYSLTGMSLWGSVLAVGLLGTIYTAIGGIKAVMWTDVLQLVIMFAALVTAIVIGTIDVGGLEHVFERSREGGRLKLSFDFDFRERYSVWGLTFGSYFLWLGRYGTNQAQIQRYLSCQSLLKAQLSVVWNIVGNVTFGFFVFLCGLLVYTKYWNCDPLLNKLIKKPDQIFPLFVANSFSSYPGLMGVFVAGIFSGSLSTLSSALNSLAAVTLEDFIKSFDRWSRMTNEKEAVVSKVLSAFYGVLCLGLVGAISNLGTIHGTAAHCTLTFSGIICGLFTLGLFFPWANSFGAIVGVVVSLIFCQWVVVGTLLTRRPFTLPFPASTEGCAQVISNVSLVSSAVVSTTANSGVADVFPLYQVSYVWIQMIGIVSVVIVGVISSFLFCPKKIEDLDIELLSPVVQFAIKRVWPEKVRMDVAFTPIPDFVLEPRRLLRTSNNMNEENSTC